MRNTTRSALGAQSAENQLAFTQNSLAERACGRLAHVIPLDVFHIAAAVANEVMVLHALGVKARGAAFDRYFPHQSSLNQVALRELNTLHRSLSRWLAAAEEAGLDQDGMVALFTNAMRDFFQRRGASGDGAGRDESEDIA